MGRLLIYTCCDEKYYMYIPLFCLSHLIYNKNTDIEIGICTDSLPDNIERSLDIIRDNYRENAIKIDYSLFKSGEFLGKHVLNNTIRFLSEPIIKDEYTYITDIDIICCEELFSKHIDDMKKNESDYSNIVRPGTNRLTGLHFTKTESYYPVDISDVDICDNDEKVLYNIVSKRNNIDINRTYRPVHGIHMSLNRPFVGGSTSTLGWGANHWKYEWYELRGNDIFLKIKPYFDKAFLGLLDKLNMYYEK